MTATSNYDRDAMPVEFKLNGRDVAAKGGEKIGRAHV